MSFAFRPQLVVLSGLAGSGKTDLLHRFIEAGEQVIDLEGLANHRGSVFGGLGLGRQPTHDAFTKALADKWQSTEPGRVVWVEDEGPYIGSVGIPVELQRLMAAAPVVELQASSDQRRARLYAEYGSAPLNLLLEALEHLENRLGEARTLTVRHAFEEGRVDSALKILLKYYDDAYLGRARQMQRELIDRVAPSQDLFTLIGQVRLWGSVRRQLTLADIKAGNPDRRHPVHPMRLGLADQSSE